VPVPRIPIRADVKVDTEQTSVAIRGPQTEAQLRALYSRASIYAATARYEPLGMAALEAAFSRCAIVANDIPSFREIWGDAALYFRTNDAASLAENIRLLNADRPMRRAYAELAYSRARERFTTKRMIDDYLQLYRSLGAGSLCRCVEEHNGPGGIAAVSNLAPRRHASPACPVDTSLLCRSALARRAAQPLPLVVSFILTRNP
jgi:hypothetical protein